jgi:hypothetical protein
VKQELSARLCEKKMAEVIKQYEVKTAEIVSDAPLFANTLLAFKPADQIDDAEEAMPEPNADT